MLQLYDEMKEIENDSQYFEIWYGFHSFNLASNHISWAELGLVSQTLLFNFLHFAIDLKHNRN